MAVMIGHASKNERGEFYNGTGGDSTKQEVFIDEYRSGKGWRVVRPLDEGIAARIAENMENACNNDNIGYDMGDRYTLTNQAKQYNYNVSNVNVQCETDCSELVRVCVLYAIQPIGLSCPGWYTGNMIGTLCSIKKDTRILFEELKGDDFRYSSNLLRRGDILVRPGEHTQVVLTNGDGSEYAGTLSSGQLSIVIGELYTTETTREDSILREVAYVNNKYEPSIISSNIKLSVINYTDLLGDLFKIFAHVSGLTTGGSSSNDASEVSANTNFDTISDNKAKTVMRLLCDHGLNVASSVGVTANIKHESGSTFNTGAVGDYGTSFGLCQWHNERGTDMKNFVGSNWATNLSGQINFLIHELKTSYKGVWEKLNSVPNSLDGCKEAAEYFCIHFEIPADRYNKAKDRAKTAEEYWNMLIVQVS